MARKARQQARRINGDGMGTPLAMAVKIWPTPQSRDWRSGHASAAVLDQNARPLSEVAVNWQTPLLADAGEKVTQASHHQGLLKQVAQWRTPTSSEDKRGDAPDWQPDPKAGEHSLTRQATQWMTPRVSETGQYQYDRGNKERPVLTLQGQAQAMPLASFLPDRPISTVGEECSHIRRTLNPLFVEWLMGWLRDWTSLALTPPASNGSACSAMALSHFKQLMRSELSAIGLPREAPPAQLTLFA
jgi:hypothetical protein